LPYYYYTIYVCIYAKLRDACEWDMWIGFLVCVGKTGRRRRFGYFVRGELETTDRGWGCTPQCIPTFTIFGAHVMGFYDTLGGHELAPI
jgi:hypothetical protein